MTFGGLPTRFDPEAGARGLALVVPGRAYSPAAPLLEFARIGLLQHGWSVHQLWWDSATMTAEENQSPGPWVRRHVEEALRDATTDRVLLVAKSLGTRAAGSAAEQGYDAIWFTPLLVVPEVAAAIAANPGRQLLVGGLGDELWDAEVAADLRRGGCDVLEVPDADHGMTVPDACRSAEIQLSVARATDEFLRSLA